MIKNKMACDHQWSYMEETIHELPDGVFSVGVGAHLIEETGMTGPEIMDSLCDFAHQIIDGGMNYGFIGRVPIYLRRRGKAVEVGTREDFKEFGWEELCDIMDKHK